ncbi:MAG: hypothetical protein RIS64_1705 [Bacteroidota bacterium]|jgi:uncharacterized phage-associated protein
MNSFNISPQLIAHYFVCTIDREAGDSITHLKLQKLLYYAQAWTMVLFNKTLFEEDFQAWMHGPVLPSIWESYKHYGFDSIPISNFEDALPNEVTELLAEIKSVYGEKSAKYLEELTHSELPWREARARLPIEARSTKPISKQTMFEFYFALNQKLENA